MSTTFDLSATNPLHAGFATVDWTPEPGLPLWGQMYQRLAQGTRDALEACTMALQSPSLTVVLVAVDVCLLDADFVAATQRQWHERSGHDASTLLLHATHTHSAPPSSDISLNEPLIPGFQEHLQQAILRAALQALAQLEPVELFAATGVIEPVGGNRRGMFEDGSSQMCGHAAMPGFIGLEGPRDADLPILFARNMSGDVTGVLVNFAIHPGTMSSGYFYSADIPGAVRRGLKQLLGRGVGVLYLTGAAGNISTDIFDPYTPVQPWCGEEGLERCGLFIAGETARVIASTTEPIASPELRLASRSIQLPLRPWPLPHEPIYPQPLLWGEEAAAWPYYRRAEEEWPQRLQNVSAVAAWLHVLRIGDVVICTNPAELFIEFGLQIRQSSPARVTFISELTDGYIGYVPTPLAFKRGGYETWCAPSSQLEPSAGTQIVDATTELMQQTFRE